MNLLYSIGCVCESRNSGLYLLGAARDGGDFHAATKFSKFMEFIVGPAWNAAGSLERELFPAFSRSPPFLR